MTRVAVLHIKKRQREVSVYGQRQRDAAKAGGLEDLC